MSVKTQSDSQDKSANVFSLTAQHLNWSSIPFEQIAESIERQMLVGEKLMICRLRFAPVVVTQQHEQVTIVERGHVKFFIEGEERIAVAGDILHFPQKCWHGTTMLDEEGVLIDISSPVRQDFLK